MSNGSQDLTRSPSGGWRPRVGAGRRTALAARRPAPPRKLWRCSGGMPVPTQLVAECRPSTRPPFASPFASTDPSFPLRRIARRRQPDLRTPQFLDVWEWVGVESFLSHTYIPTSSSRSLSRSSSIGIFVSILVPIFVGKDRDEDRDKDRDEDWMKAMIGSSLQSIPIPIRILIMPLLRCCGPGVLRPFCTSASSSAVSAATMSGCCSMTLVRSPTSALRS